MVPTEPEKENRKYSLANYINIYHNPHKLIITFVKAHSYITHIKFNKEVSY